MRHKVSQGELAFLHLARQRLGLFLVIGLLRLLNQGEHIAHIEDASGHPLGMETLKITQVFAGRGKKNRLPGYSPHRKRRPAASVTIEFRQHYPGKAHPVTESNRGLHCVLPHHSVQDKQNLVGVNRVADIACLAHHFFIDTQPTGGIDNDYVIAFGNRQVQSRTRHLDRIALPIPGCGGVNIYPRFFGDNL